MCYENEIQQVNNYTNGWTYMNVCVSQYCAVDENYTCPYMSLIILSHRHSSHIWQTTQFPNLRLRESWNCLGLALPMPKLPLRGPADTLKKHITTHPRSYTGSGYYIHLYTIIYIYILDIYYITLTCTQPQGQSMWLPQHRSRSPGKPGLWNWTCPGAFWDTLGCCGCTSVPPRGPSNGVPKGVRQQGWQLLTALVQQWPMPMICASWWIWSNKINNTPSSPN